jgi:UDP-N-acetylglucosamine 2-epimerase (non-hydrolysing)
LIAEGIRPETIIKTGSHMQEVLDYFLPKIQQSRVLEDLQLFSMKYFLVSAHREENVDTPANLQDLVDTLEALVKQYDLPVIVSTHPRTRQRLEKLGLKGLDSRIQFLNPFGFFDYIKLQMEAFCILSDSGTITEEASLLNLPAVTIRNAHERPEGMDEGTLVMSGLQKDRVLDVVRVVVAQHDRDRRVMRLVADYETGPVSKKVLRIVLSYVDYVKRTVWHQ